MTMSAEALPHPTYRLGFSSNDEETERAELRVEGALPSWLAGTLIRTGPAKFEVGSQSYTHWFDGLAMLHRYQIERGRVIYSSRFLRSRSLVDALRQNRIVHSEFMTDPCRSLLGRVMSFFDPRPTDNGSVSVAMLDGRALALTETRLPIEFDPETLETIGYHAYAASIGGQLTMAHPHHDGRRGYSFVTHIGRRSSYRLFVDDAGTQRAIAEVRTDEPSYMHSFGMSHGHLILTEFPLRVHPLRLAFSSEPFIRRYSWQPNRGTTITVIAKKDGSVAARAHTAPCFAFHHVNAFEQDGELVIDLLCYPDASIIDQLRLDRLRSGEVESPLARLTRLRVPLGCSQSGPGSHIEPIELGEAGFELPRIDYGRRAGRPYRFVWGAGQTQAGNFLDNITKIDIRSERSVDAKTWCSPACYPGEPVFVPRPAGTNEDDGILLSVVLDATEQSSFLLVLDAASLGELARARLPYHVPFGFHGDYFPQ